MPTEEYEEALHTFHQYFELSNYQVFLRRRRRIRDDTWAEWREGILHTMRRPAFRRAWEEIKHRSPDSYPELFVFEAEAGAADPKSWPEGHVEQVNRRRTRGAGPAV